MEELIGKSVIGFKFKSGKTSHTSWNKEMKSYIGLVGEIRDIHQNETVKVVFSDGEYWWYPIDQIIEHLVEPTWLKKYTARCSSCKSFFQTNNKRSNICEDCSKDIKPLVETSPSQKVLTPLDKLMSFLIDKQYFIGNDLYEEFKKLKEEEKELFFNIACRGIYGMSSETDAKKFIEERFE
jgi:hypothetical protein